MTAASNSERVLITGYGAATPFGLGADALHEGMMAGESKVEKLKEPLDQLRPGYGGVVSLTARDIRGLPNSRDMRPGTMTRYTFLSTLALGNAMAHGDVPFDEGDAALRRGFYVASYTNSDRFDKYVRFAHHVSGEDASGAPTILDSEVPTAIRKFSGFEFLKLMNNMPTAHVSIQANVRGPANTFLGHSSVGLQAVGRAWDAIRLGQADQFIAGASGPGTIEGMCLIRQSRGMLASPSADPETASRPFDATSTGLVPADGAAAFILETEESAAARCGRPLAQLAAYNESFSLPPSARGPLASSADFERLIEGLLAEAGWTADSVDYIGACAPGHPDLDAVEAQGLVNLFGLEALGQKLAVHTGVTGFTEAAHGALALVGALQAMEDATLPPMVNLDVPAGALAGMAVRHQPASADVRRAIAYSIAPEGTMTAVAIERV